MKKFEKVKNALEELTRDSNNWLTITENIDGRHTGKYALQNVVTGNVFPISYKTLNEIIKEFNLVI
ncbi:hypothetical protein [uncultured Clostridium sp.]|uniref:hypothetical protein n=1 Tax=uncultured Clostridium sp. TaxID=59620 RepID=UPI00260409A3|nr:hypothetical protein [uncultured Clostridium sp.]